MNKNVFGVGLFFVFLITGGFALLKIAPKLLPDLGRVVEKGGISCVEFRDTNKNYEWGKIEVIFNNELTGVEAHRILKTEDFYLTDQEIEDYATGSAYIIDVPRGTEEDAVKKLKTKEGIKEVSLVNCK